MHDMQVAAATAYSDELQLHSVLGEGGFSTVYNGTWHGSSTAIKVRCSCSATVRAAHTYKISCLLPARRVQLAWMLPVCCLRECNLREFTARFLVLQVMRQIVCLLGSMQPASTPLMSCLC
jgi:hypothetical protein